MRVLVFENEQLNFPVPKLEVIAFTSRDMYLALHKKLSLVIDIAETECFMKYTCTGTSTRASCLYNESTAGADASVEALKLYNMKLAPVVQIYLL